MPRKSYSKFRSRWWAFCEIDRQIRREMPCTVKSLAADLEVDPRTVRRYIAFMREDLAAPIEWDPIDQRYRLTDLTWTMPNVHLSDQEMLALAVAARTLSAVTPDPLAGSLEGLLAKLLDALPTQHREELATLRERVDFLPVAVPSKGAEWVLPIVEALRQRLSLDFDYLVQSKQVRTTRGVDPYHLRFYSGTWYLIGYCHLTKQIPVFSLARIKRLVVTDESFKAKKFSTADYFRNAFGITVGGELRKVRVQLTGWAARTAGEKLWPEGFVYVPAADGTGILAGTIGNSQDLLMWIAAQGGDAVLLNDDDLKV
jgi:predicted DNA-binding transcriptional regulator YafY